MVREYLLKTDSFLNPKKIEGLDAIGVLLMRLLMTEPGSNPLRPGMGVGLGSKYRFISEPRLSELQSVIEDQIATNSSAYPDADSELGNRRVIDIDAENCLVVSLVIKDVEFVLETKSLETPVYLSEVVE